MAWRLLRILRCQIRGKSWGSEAPRGSLGESLKVGSQISTLGRARWGSCCGHEPCFAAEADGRKFVERMYGRLVDRVLLCWSQEYMMRSGCETFFLVAVSRSKQDEGGTSKQVLYPGRRVVESWAAESVRRRGRTGCWWVGLELRMTFGWQYCGGPKTPSEQSGKSRSVERVQGFGFWTFEQPAA